MKYVVDTNVPIVANDRVLAGERKHSLSCTLAAIQFLTKLHNRGVIVIDSAGKILAEYRRYLAPSGQPGVGDRFYLDVLNYHPKSVELIELDIAADGEFADCPASLVLADFDPADRKFVALANKAGCPVAHAVDGGWIEHGALLDAEGIVVNHLCGPDPHEWFEQQSIIISD